MLENLSYDIINLYQVSCGLNHTMCVSADGSTAWAFGDGDYGKLGLGNTTRVLSPAKIEALQGVRVKKVLCGAQFSVALANDGVVYTWGQGNVSFRLLMVLRNYGFIEKLNICPLNLS